MLASLFGGAAQQGQNSGEAGEGGHFCWVKFRISAGQKRQFLTISFFKELLSFLN